MRSCGDDQRQTSRRIDTGLRQIRFQYGPASAACFVPYSNGLFLPVEGMSMDAAELAARADEVFVTLLKRLQRSIKRSAHISRLPMRQSGSTNTPTHKEFRKQEFKLAMQRLLGAKVIEIRIWGRAGRKTHYLAFVGEG
jgi:hypothetical protein